MPDLVPVDYAPDFAEQAGTQSLAGMLGSGIASLTGQPSWTQQAADLSERQEAMRQAGASQGQIVRDTLDQAIGVAPQFAGQTEGPPGIRAYHGSPYDFDKFDISKIGTGEGAQAYGHGLYFAEHPDTANAYRPLGEPLPQSHWLNKVEPLLDRAEDFVAPARGKYFSDQLRDYLENRARPGKTYEVNINADPEHFLDWDKPLSEQSPQVQEALKSQGITNLEEVKYASQNPEAVAALRQAGIPGIKYLDQGSRGSGQGTHNYVVFNPDIISILKKYGLAGLIAGGAAHFSTQPVDHQPQFQ